MDLQIREVYFLGAGNRKLFNDREELQKFSFHFYNVKTKLKPFVFLE